MRKSEIINDLLQIQDDLREMGARPNTINRLRLIISELGRAIPESYQNEAFPSPAKPKFPLKNGTMLLTDKGEKEKLNQDYEYTSCPVIVSRPRIKRANRKEKNNNG